MAWPYWQYLATPRPASPPPERVAAGWPFPLLRARRAREHGDIVATRDFAQLQRIAHTPGDGMIGARRIT